jgi:PIN domain nuclease of toxin-antitoxin system
VILDTHVWVFYATGAPLSKRGLQRIEKSRKARRLQIAAVTLWEVALLAQERKIRFAQPPGEWFRDALARTEVTVAALDAAIAIEAARLVSLLRDPADCQIVGTALYAGVPLGTRDGRLLENASALGLEVVDV